MPAQSKQSHKTNMHPKKANAVRIIGLNMNGANKDGTKLNDILRLLGLLKWDILCLQETHLLMSADHAALAIRIGGKHAQYSFTNGLNSRDGILTVCRGGSGLWIDSSTKYFDNKKQGGWLKTVMRGEFGRFELLNTYLPSVPKSRIEFLETQMPEMGVDAVVLGDMNVTLDPLLDRYNMETEGGEGALELAWYCAENDLSDQFRDKHPDRCETSYYPSPERKKGTLIDRVFTSDSLNSVCAVSEIHDLGLDSPDHKCTITDLLLNDLTLCTPKFVWNNRLLRHSGYKEKMEDMSNEAKVKFSVSVDKGLVLGELIDDITEL